MEASLIEKGKDRGYLLSDEVIAAFPHPEDDVELLDDLYHSLLENGIEVLDDDPNAGKGDLKSRLALNGNSNGAVKESSNGHHPVPDPIETP